MNRKRLTDGERASLLRQATDWHDSVYATGTLPRWEADAVLYYLLRTAIGVWKATFVFWAVRLFVHDKPSSRCLRLSRQRLLVILAEVLGARFAVDVVHAEIVEAQST